MTDNDLRRDGDPTTQQRGGRLSAAWIDRRLPRTETGLDTDCDALALAAGLLAGLVAFVPAFGAAVDLLDLPVPVPLLVGVALVGAAYAAVVVALRRWVVGSVAALVVLATFKANVPLLAATYQFPGDIVGDLLLVHVPLALLAAVAVWRGWLRRSRELPLVLFAAFVAATLVPTLLGRPPAPLAAVAFTLFVFLGLLAFAVCVRVVAEGILQFRTLVATMFFAVGAHAAFGLVQLVNQRPFGLTRLGEGGGLRPATVAIPVVGDVYIGTFVSGFTGMAFVLSYLIVLVLPAGIVLVARREGVERYLGAAGLIGLVVVLRASTSDAARGAVLVALATVAVLLAVQYRERAVDTLRQLAGGRGDRVREAATATAGAVLGLAIVALPSSASGEAARATAEGGGGTGGLDVSQLSIPLFNLTNLGVRLQQYAVALDLFAQFPLFGLGGMSYVVVAPEYGMPVPNGQNFAHPVHSLYFTLLAETGAVGTALYLGAVAAALYAGWRLLDRDGVDAALVVGVLAGLVGALAFATFDILTLYAGPGFFPFWIVAGALVGEAARHDAVPTPL